MASIVGVSDLSISLIDAGNRLLSLPSSTQELLTLLDETESLLRGVGQAQPLSRQHALTPTKDALVSSQLLTHPDSDVRVSLVSCLTEIMRITSPQPPYSDDQMKEIFRLTVEAFEKLADVSSSRSYGKAEFVLDTVARLSSCLVMLDLECHDLILQMFRIFLKVIRSDHPSVVPSSMEMIMVSVIDETDQVSNDLLGTLLTSVKKENQSVSPMSWSLAEKVLSRCARKLQPYIIKAFNVLDLYSPVVSSIYHTVFETPKVSNVVNTKAYEDKVKLGGSKRPARGGTIRISVNDRVRKGRNSWKVSKHSLKKEVQCEGKRDSLKLRGSPSSLGRVVAKKTTPALTGSVKRRRVSIDESDDDSDEEANEDSYEEESEDERKIRNSSKKVVNSSGKRSSAARTDTKKKKAYTSDFGEGLVGKRVNIWWPLDKTFYEGVIKSYCSLKKTHLVLYTDGVTEELNLIKERWELLEDEEDMKKDSSGEAREGKNLKSFLNAETDRREVSEDVDSLSEDEYYNGEKQEQSGNKSQGSLKVADREGEAKEEGKQDPNSETESDREGSESGEEPKWRETEDTEEDEAEEADDDDKVRSTKLA